MNKFILKLQKVGLNINQLKIIAVVTMIIDHLGYYFRSYINNSVYYILRAIGRISMPLFAFILVQGFFHTKDIKKYVVRVFSVAIITQLVIYVAHIFDKDAYNLSVNTQLNILFSYTLSLITLWLIHEKTIINKLNCNQNIVLKIFLIITIIGIFVFIPIDYTIYVPMLITLFYFIEKLKITIYLQKQNYTISVKNVLVALIDDAHIKIVYNALIFLAMLLIVIESRIYMYWYMLFSILPIYLYNGQRGKKSKRIDVLFYLIFPVQHFLLYILSVI